MGSKQRIFRIILRVLGVLAAAGYILFLFEGGIPIAGTITFADFSVYLLFAVFLTGLIFIWNNELTAGIIFLVWYGLQWILVFWVWVDGALTLVLGLPIGILGLLLLLFGLIKRRKKTEIQE